MTELVVIWGLLLTGLLVLVIRGGGHGGALILAYFLGASLIHVPGAVIYLGSAPGLMHETETRTGFQATVWGMGALVSGAWAMSLLVGRRRTPGTPRDMNDRRVGMILVAVGLASFFLALPIAYLVPSVQVLVGGFAGALILGIWVLWFGAARAGQGSTVLLLLAAVPFLPLLTTALHGFISFGISWVIAAVAFGYVESRRKWVYVAAAPLVAVVGLSVSVAYFSEREAIRRAVWEDQAALRTRFDIVLGVGDKLELLDLESHEHVRLVNDRLNQNYLFGLGLIRHEQGLVDLEYGGTIPVWMFVPRFLWPEKPQIGGGRDVVSQFTGITFAEFTSVGAGQFIEFYFNFGWYGLLVGSFLLGALLMWLDAAIVSALTAGDVGRFLLVGLPGVTLLQPGGNLMEIIVSIVGAVVAAYVLREALKASGVIGPGAPESAVVPSPGRVPVA